MRDKLKTGILSAALTKICGGKPPSGNPERRSLLAALEGGKLLGRHPLSVQIQTVSTCDGSCYFCPYLESWHRDHPGVMAEDLYRHIIEELSVYRIAKFCPYLENEPLLDPNLFERIEFGLSRLDFQLLELSTNAASLSQAQLEDMTRILPPVPHEIWVSFHGVDSETYQSIMGLDYNVSLARVLALVEAAQNSGMNIVIKGAGAPVYEQSDAPFWFDEETYLKFWEKQFISCGFKRKPKIHYFKYHDRAGAINRNQVNFSKSFNRDLSDFYCIRLDNWLHFLYTGEMVLCCMDYHKKTVFANIQGNNLSDIITSDKYKKLARMVTGEMASPDDFICKKCISPGG